MLLRILKAEGHSMEPIIRNGSFFMISNAPFIINEPKVDDIVVFKYKNKLIVKSISKIEHGKIFVKGKNKNDSKNFSFISKSEILGKVLWIF